MAARFPNSRLRKTTTFGDITTTSPNKDKKDEVTAITGSWRDRKELSISNNQQSKNTTSRSRSCSSRYEPTRNYRPVDNQAPLQSATGDRDISRGWRISKSPESLVPHEDNQINITQPQGVSDGKEVTQPDTTKPKEITNSANDNNNNGTSRRRRRRRGGRRQQHKSADRTNTSTKLVDLIHRNWGRKEEKKDESIEVKKISEPRETNQPEGTINPAKINDNGASKRRRRCRRHRNPANETKTNPNQQPIIDFLIHRSDSNGEIETIRCRSADPDEPKFHGSTFWKHPDASELPIPASYLQTYPPTTPWAESTGWESDEEIVAIWTEGESDDTDPTLTSDNKGDIDFQDLLAMYAAFVSRYQSDEYSDASSTLDGCDSTNSDNSEIFGDEGDIYHYREELYGILQDIHSVLVEKLVE